MVNANLLGDTKEADNPNNNIICKNILINVIFGCESIFWRLRSGVNRGCARLPVAAPCPQ